MEKKFCLPHSANSAITDKDINTSKLVRINKALADAGVCSRRKAEELIVAGKVFVNDVRVTDLSYKVCSTDTLVVENKKISRGQSRCYLMLHKPIQTICTAQDPEGRTTIFDILPAQWRQKRLFTVGRLDYFSEGLLLLTDDGNLAQRLSHPSFHLPKKYSVLVRETVLNTHMTTMKNGMTLSEGQKLAPVDVHIVKNTQRGTFLEMTLYQGINRQIRHMCRDLGLTILQLKRIAQGSLILGDLPMGEVRELCAEEIALLTQK